MLLYSLIEKLVDCPDIAFDKVDERQNRKAQQSGFCYLGTALVDGYEQLLESWVERTGWQNAWLALLTCQRTSAVVATVSWDWSKPRLILAGKRLVTAYQTLDELVQQPLPNFVEQAANLYENYQSQLRSLGKNAFKQGAAFYAALIRKPLGTA
ncbi:MAG: hypothetical protein VKJ04_06185 [Vampirovibrionales bacterium]|nr:hypothetical protein [Vampirovibrionales bacterium]